MLTQERLKELLVYDKKTGEFIWLPRCAESFPGRSRPEVIAKSFNKRDAFRIAGNESRCKRSKTSYIHIKVEGKSYKAHRLAFLYMTGDMPHEVDHIDHNGLNNKWENLRWSNPRDNAKNPVKQKSNKTGVTGVNWHKSAKKWQAIAVNREGKRIDLGRFDDFDEAVEARKKHEIIFGYHEHRS